MDARSELNAAWKRFTLMPIPALKSDDDELHELRVDLIEFDGHAAGLISTVLGHSRPALPLDADPELRRRGERRIADEDPLVAADAQKLAAYIADLERLLASARRVPVQGRNR